MRRRKRVELAIDIQILMPKWVSAPVSAEAESDLSGKFQPRVREVIQKFADVSDANRPVEGMRNE